MDGEENRIMIQKIKETHQKKHVHLNSFKILVSFSDAKRENITICDKIIKHEHEYL